ncbi:hypothetical protein P3T76_010995 [Phytophthora citrophthora]|uniref:Uncharacterized protein n=1 Tax=Phytophthora citrophthora TaxID=4793 RepID=A0AAD9LH70_9STRA|nr:hypothetical protein P3T76_010995 [Phytophthora citrophthora]
MLAGETDLSAFLKRTLPVVSVDGRFPIENPFTGHTSGYLKGRVCFGTAQQILTWSKTIRAVIELQGIIRGVSSRQHFGGFIPAKPRANFMLNRSLAEDLSSVDNRSEFQSTTPTVTPGIRVTGLDDNTADDLNFYEMVQDQDDFGRRVLTVVNRKNEKATLHFSHSDDETHDTSDQHEEHTGVSDIESVANYVANTSPYRGVDADDKTVLLQNDNPSEAVQRDKIAYAEKNVQVNAFELEQIKMVSCSIQTTPPENLPDDDEGNDQLGDIISTVDVGCDAMEDTDTPGETCQFAEKAIQVDPSELGLHIEMVARSVQTVPVPEESIQIEPAYFDRCGYSW